MLKFLHRYAYYSNGLMDTLKLINMCFLELVQFSIFQGFVLKGAIRQGQEWVS